MDVFWPLINSIYSSAMKTVIWYLKGLMLRINHYRLRWKKKTTPHSYVRLQNFLWKKRILLLYYYYLFLLLFTLILASPPSRSWWQTHSLKNIHILLHFWSLTCYLKLFFICFLKQQMYLFDIPCENERDSQYTWPLTMIYIFLRIYTSGIPLFHSLFNLLKYRLVFCWGIFLSLLLQGG